MSVVTQEDLIRENQTILDAAEGARKNALKWQRIAIELATLKFGVEYWATPEYQSLVRLAEVGVK